MIKNIYKKHLSVKKSNININIKNENSQQSNNKYVKPPPELNKNQANVPAAYPSGSRLPPDVSSRRISGMVHDGWGAKMLK